MLLLVGITPLTTRWSIVRAEGEGSDWPDLGGALVCVSMRYMDVLCVCVHCVCSGIVRVCVCVCVCVCLCLFSLLGEGLKMQLLLDIITDV